MIGENPPEHEGFLSFAFWNLTGQVGQIRSYGVPVAERKLEQLGILGSH